MKRQCYLLIVGVFLFSCCENSSTQKIKAPVVIPKKQQVEILIQPFSDLPVEKSKYVFIKIREKWPNTKLLPAVPIPAVAFYKPRNRYRADSLLKWLSPKANINQKIVGITSKDISTTKGNNPDHGVMGLGAMGGKSCMISTFRLKKGSNEQLFKTVIHELGHNFNLPHCSIEACYMADAKGKNPLDKETDFCPSCKTKLINVGWKL